MNLEHFKFFGNRSHSNLRKCVSNVLLQSSVHLYSFKYYIYN